MQNLNSLYHSLVSQLSDPLCSNIEITAQLGVTLLSTYMYDVLVGMNPVGRQNLRI